MEGRPALALESCSAASPSTVSVVPSDTCGKFAMRTVQCYSAVVCVFVCFESFDAEGHRAKQTKRPHGYAFLDSVDDSSGES